MVWRRADSGELALAAQQELVGEFLLWPRLKSQALRFAAKLRDQQTRDLGDEPMALFDRMPSKPPHKRQGFGQGLKFSIL